MSVSTDVLAEDEVAVQSTLDGILAAWADNNGDEFAKHFAEHATIVTVEGLYCKDREPIRQLITMLYNGPFKGSKVFQRIEDLKFVTPDVAIAVCWNGILMGGLSELPPEENRRATYVLSKQDGTWYVESFQNVFITEPKTELVG